MKLIQLRHGLFCLLLGVPTMAVAQPDYADHYETSVSGEAIVSVDVFYDQLTPYGAWVDDPELGRVFTPESAQFVPYTVGHWQYTDVGFVWISAQPFDWATAHYGRWAYSTPFGRWVWLPDTTWGPSWVEWRQSGDDFGWAPLAPEVAIRVGYAPPVESWHYCNSAHVLDVDVTRYYEPRARVIEIHREARPIEHYAQISGARVVVGPSAATLHEHHVEARPVKLEAHAAGRWTPTESVAAAKHAEDHRATNEVANGKRIASNPTLHQATLKIAAKAPPKLEEPKPAPAKPEPKQVKQVPPRPEAKPAPKQVEPKQSPKQVEPKQSPKQVEPKQPPKQVEPKQPPKQVEPKQPPKQVEPKQPPKQVEPKQSPKQVEPRPQPPKQVEPKQPPKQVEPKPQPPKQVEPKQPPKQVEPRPQPPKQAEPKPAPPAEPKPAPRTPDHKPNEK